MRKISAIIFLFFVSLGFSKAQNYVISKDNTGINPSSLNVNYKAPFGILSSTWKSISEVGFPYLSSIDTTTKDHTFYSVKNGTFVVNQAKLSSVIVDPYVIVPGLSNVTGYIENLGSATITTIEIKYEVGGTTYASSLSGLNIFSGSYATFTHPTPVNVINPTFYPIKVWIELAGDADHSDDTLSTSSTGLSFQTTKRVLIEEATGTWCGWCPRGAVYSEQLDANYPGSAIVVAVHNDDPMTNVIYDTGMVALINGYPSGALDRKSNAIDPTNFDALYNQRINDISFADVAISASFDQSSRQVDVTVSATFSTDLNGDYRLNAILVEDNVSDTSSGYNQTNYYSINYFNLPLVGAGHNWQVSPNPIAAALMEYDFVGRDILGGFDGQPNSIPSTIFANSTYSYTFTTTIPSTWDETQMKVIGTVNNATTGHIINVNRGAYGITTQVKEITAENFSISLYPNPAHESSQLAINLKQSTSYNVDLFDVFGKLTFSQLYNGTQGKNVISIPLNGLSNGVYFVRVNVNGSIVSTHLVKN